MTECPDARFFAGWYSLMSYNEAFDWTPGAIGIHFDSYSAREFRQGGRWGCWTAGAIEAGITATAGAVWEPYVSGFIEPDRFLARMAFDGSSLAEAAWSSIPKLRWMMVVFGDPLFSYARKYPEVVIPEPDPIVESPEYGDILECYDASIADPSASFDSHGTDVLTDDAITGDVTAGNDTTQVVDSGTGNPTSDTLDTLFTTTDSISGANDATQDTTESNGCTISRASSVKKTTFPEFVLLILMLTCFWGAAWRSGAAAHHPKDTFSQ